MNRYWVPLVVASMLLVGWSVQAQQSPPRQIQPSTVPGAAGAPQIRREAPAQVAAPQRPQGFPLAPADQKRMDQILSFWQQNTTNIKTFECRFRKWDYDGVFGVRQDGKLLPKTESDGMLRYSKPDKGLYQVTEVRDLVPPQAGERPKFKKREGAAGERWVCDGATVYEFDFRQKRLVQTLLPPDMRGQAITTGPLPFMFGARANEIKQRYWMRELTPPKNVTNQYWLEAYPKRREDAANFKRVVVFLDRQKFLPIAMRIYERNGKSYSAYSFSHRKTNDLASHFDNWRGKFIPKKLPAGWQQVTRNYADSGAQQQATRPAAPRTSDARSAAPTTKTPPASTR